DAGLWLWQGEAPSTPALPRPKSRTQQILRRLAPAVGWAGWIALPICLALMLIAILMMRHPDRPVSADTSPVARSSAPSPTAAPAIVTVPPATLTKAQMDQVQLP